MHKRAVVATIRSNLGRQISTQVGARNQILAKQLGNLKPFPKEDALWYANSRSLEKKTEVWNYFENKWRGH